MIVALNRTRGRAPREGGMFDGTHPVLNDPEAQPVIRRCLANTCEFSTIDRREHALAVAAVVMRARRLRKENTQ